MSRREAPFKYRLEPLLKVDRWEGRVLGAELGRARQLMDDCQRQHREVLARVQSTEGEIRALDRAGEGIPIERRRVLAAYLEQQYALAGERGEAAARAQRLFEQILAQRQANQQRVRALEHHEAREHARHDGEQVRAGLRDADEQWLNTRGGRR